MDENIEKASRKRFRRATICSVLAKHQYAGLMKVVRPLEEQGQTFTLPDGKSVKAVVEEVLPEVFSGFAKQQAKAQKAEADRYKAAKAQNEKEVS